MNEDEFIETVRREASLESTDDARRPTAATLRTLGERLTDGQAEDLARGVPDGLAEPLVDASPGEADPISLETFTERVGDRAEIDEDVVVHARAVSTALAAAADDEFEAAREQLPSEFDVLFEPGGPVTEAEFVESVRERADLASTEAARDAATATLRTLGERLSAGEAADLAHYLPDPLAAELADSGDDSATAYSLDEFVARVAQREGVEKEAVADHVRAVCRTLADAASEREVAAAKRQLPDPFGTLFEPPSDGDE